jgi:septation ring formation regulator EzrA
VPEISPAVLALLGAILGGSGLKIVEHSLNRSKSRNESEASMRAELREEIKSLREELRKVQAELDSWRIKYYELQEEFIAARDEFSKALRQVADTQ